MTLKTSPKKIAFHDLEDGRAVSVCQVCGGKKLHLAIDLGFQPLCDSLLTQEQVRSGTETHFPLRQVWCEECALNQIDYVVPPTTVFHLDYPYRSGITKELAVYQNAFAAEISKQLGLDEGLVVDIGSNDGTLLTGFKAEGFRVLGVEPTNIAKIAVRENKIPTLQAFFDEKTAARIRAEHGPASLAVATNVFAHVSRLGEFIRGLKRLLVPKKGFFVLENHYLLQILNKTQFDSIYHEHLRSYSLLSLVKLFELYDMTVVSARQVDRYGGNIRVVVANDKDAVADSSVAEILRLEKKAGLTKAQTYVDFRERSLKIKNDLKRFLIDCHEKGKSVLGNSCPGRASTLLNFAGIGPDLLPFLGEQPTSLKLGMFTPGTHIPVVKNDILLERRPEYVVLLAWHYAEPIMRQWRERGLRSKFVIPFPEFTIV